MVQVIGERLDQNPILYIILLLCEVTINFIRKTFFFHRHLHIQSKTSAYIAGILFRMQSDIYRVPIGDYNYKQCSFRTFILIIRSEQLVFYPIVRNSTIKYCRFSINGDGLQWQQWLMMVALVNLLLPGAAIQWW